MLPSCNCSNQKFGILWKSHIIKCRYNLHFNSVLKYKGWLKISCYAPPRVSWKCFRFYDDSILVWNLGHFFVWKNVNQFKFKCHKFETFWTFWQKLCSSLCQFKPRNVNERHKMPSEVLICFVFTHRQEIDFGYLCFKKSLYCFLNTSAFCPLEHC